MVSLQPCHLGDTAECARLVELAVSEFGRIDVLYNLAARSHLHWFEGFTDEEWDAARKDEVDMVFYLTRAAWPPLKASRGVVVNMASLNGSLSFKNLPAIAHMTNRAAIIGITRQLAMEGGEHGIRVNSISPGLIESNATRGELEDEQWGRAMRDRTLLGRFDQPEDELRLRADPKASPVRARTIGTSVTVGALGVGPLIAGCLAQWVTQPLTVPYLVFIALGAIALIGLWAAPETGAPATEKKPAGSRRKVRLPVPAAAGTLVAFSANGLFAGLSGLFLATTLHHPSHALSGAALFLLFACGVVSQLATLQASRVLALGTVSMLAGLVLLVVSVRLYTPNLAMFLIGGALIGAGSGAVFKGTTGIVLEASPPESRVAMTSDLLIALYVGLSVPVIGAGVALDLGASAPNTVLGFAILVGLGVVVSGWALLRRRP
jgi:NAD(P)-dependent dehydrogenase (short-subunit alcohol dehydrogenase family)